MGERRLQPNGMTLYQLPWRVVKMANTVRLESGWLFRQLESAERRASNLPFWLSQPRVSDAAERSTDDQKNSDKDNDQSRE